ncbi:MAG: Hpt domain-containing protein, partial [Spirochaetota bacterium]
MPIAQPNNDFNHNDRIMAELHRLLKRQIKKILRGKTENLAPETVQKFIDDVNEAYVEADKEKDFLQRRQETNLEEIKARKKEIDDIMHNVAQGILTINRDGKINPEFSEKTISILGRNDIANNQFSSLFYSLGLQEKIDEYFDVLFTSPYITKSMIRRLNPLQDLNYQITDPNTGNCDTKRLKITFSRIYGKGNQEVDDIDKLMAVVHDRTHEYLLEQRLEENTKKHARKLEKLYQILSLDTEIFTDFVKEANEILAEIKQTLISNDILNAAESKRCVQDMHTLKGNAKALNLDAIAELAHELEEKFAKQLGQSCQELLPDIEAMIEELKDGSSLLDKILNMKQALKSEDSTSGTEKVLKGIIDKETKNLGKQVKLQFENTASKETVAKYTLKIRRMLVHLVRNSLSHGISIPC